MEKILNPQAFVYLVVSTLKKIKLEILELIYNKQVVLMNPNINLKYIWYSERKKAQVANDSAGVEIKE